LLLLPSSHSMSRPPIRRPPPPPLFPYTTLFRSSRLPNRPNLADQLAVALGGNAETLSNVAPGPRREGLPTLNVSLLRERLPDILDRKSTRLNSSHGSISYAVFCLKKKNTLFSTT